LLKGGRHPILDKGEQPLANMVQRRRWREPEEDKERVGSAVAFEDIALKVGHHLRDPGIARVYGRLTQKSLNVDFSRVWHG